MFNNVPSLLSEINAKRLRAQLLVYFIHWVQIVDIKCIKLPDKLKSHLAPRIIKKVFDTDTECL